VGREPELAVCREAFSGAPALVCVEGEHRMGRTTLLEACAELAEDMGFTVLAAQLPGTADHTALPELSRRFRDLAAITPVLVTADDLDLAGADGVRLLTDLRRRLADLPVAMIVTTLPGRLPELPAALRITLGCLDEDAVRELAGDDADACYRATGGHPGQVAELLHEAAVRDVSVAELCREPSADVTLAYDLAERGQLVEAARLLAGTGDGPARPKAPGQQRFWHAIMAASHTLSGDRNRATAALHEAMSPSPDRRTARHLVTALSMMDEFDQAERLCDNDRLGLGLRTDLAVRRGDLREGRRLTLLQPDPHVTALAPMIATLIDVNEPQAAAVLLSAQGLDGEAPASAHYDTVLFQRGRLRAVTGDQVRAVHDLLECGRRLEQRDVVNPAVCPWRSTAALLLAELDDHRRAETLVERELHLARRWGTASTVGIAMRAAGVVTGDVKLLAEAVDTLRDSPARLEYGRALAAWGRRLRETGDEQTARSVLRMAHAMAMRCGSVVLAERAGRELKRAGGRRRFAADPALLTERESFVARRAAAGRTNKEIADELYVTTRSVEFALTGAYRKLGLSGRRELRDALGPGTY
jgi:DNA-binding CsgD family transcriptional regulator